MMLPALYNKHKGAILTPLNHPLGRPLIPLSEGGDDISYKRNPLMGFVWTSADVLAEEALENLRDATPSARATAKAILDAQYMHEMPPNLPHKIAPPISLKDPYERVMARLAEMEASYESVLNDPERRLDSTVFDEEIAKFADCIQGRTNRSCEAILAFINEIGESPQDQGEGDFNQIRVAFIDLLIKNKVREIWKAYHAGDKPLAEVFLGLDEMWYAYEKFKTNLVAIVFDFDRSGENREVPEGVKEAFVVIAESFEKAYASVKPWVFEELRNEAIRVKLTRMRQAANLLAEHGASLPDGYAARTLGDMASKLNCLTQYPVGPAFDAPGPGTHEERVGRSEGGER